MYEFFLVNGEKMSASKGNVYIVQDLLKVMEPEAFMFFYAKRPEKQRDLELKRIFETFPGKEKIQLKVGEQMIPLPLTVTMSPILEKKIEDAIAAYTK